MFMIDEIKRKKALKYLRYVNYKTLIKANDLNQTYVINEKRTPEAMTYEHHLPLLDENKLALDSSNWDLPDDDKEKINNELKKLEKYYFAVCDAYGDMPYHRNQNNRRFVRELLPPWIAFPLYSVRTIGWRMGCGEEYKNIFSCFLSSLTEEQRKEYEETYPEPEYMRIYSPNITSNRKRG